MVLNGILIANKDQAARKEMPQLFNSDSCRVTLTDSVANALEGLLNRSIQVVSLSGSSDEEDVAKFVPLMKKCNRKLSIILIFDDMPLELLRAIMRSRVVNVETLEHWPSRGQIILSSLLLWLVISSQAYAMDPSSTFCGGLLLVLFAGFIALLFAFQLVLALLALAGKTEEAAKVYEGTLVSSKQETSD